MNNLQRGILRLINTVELVMRVRRERRNLLRLDDRALKDLGLNSCHAYGEAARPVWDVANAANAHDRKTRR